MSALATTAPVTPLRVAQRELTRSRIRDAARDLFYAQHYDITTMDQIATAAGLRRSTVYLHYRDKAQILSDIITDYAPRARAMMAKLPGPVPSEAQIDRWVEQVVAFKVTERAPVRIMTEVSLVTPELPGLQLMVVELIEGLAESVPAFAAALDPKAIARARAYLLILQLTFACNYTIFGSEKTLATSLRRAVVEAFADYIEGHQPKS